jgi:hypothetical protein
MKPPAAAERNQLDTWPLWVGGADDIGEVYIY